jgi:hypothetical protein
MISEKNIFRLTWADGLEEQITANNFTIESGALMFWHVDRPFLAIAPSEWRFVRAESK